ncbi:hypothetical protein [Devosia beringensis]|uniref:hypothetical protein n=1 Tax=Devosia beringensis TaxID=2657486 RepID=UPI00186B643C|nr:hypothetical protein [Devosia beringensis]
MPSKAINLHLAACKAWLRRLIDLKNEVRGLQVYGVKLPARIYDARLDDLARQAVNFDPTIAEAWSAAGCPRSSLPTFLEINQRVRAIAHDDPICI